jgi:hypothetical protein
MSPENGISTMKPITIVEFASVAVSLALAASAGERQKPDQSDHAEKPR